MHNATIQGRGIMAHFLSIFLLGVGTFQARGEEPAKPGPEQKDLTAWVGEWKYDVQTKATPLGPAEKFSGKITYRLALNGFYLEGKWSEKHADGTTGIGEEWHWFDPATKTRLVNAYGNDGFVTVGTETVKGAEWTSQSTQTDHKGQTSKVRTEGSFSADGKRFTGKWELSMDGGKTWLPWWDITTTKTGK